MLTVVGMGSSASKPGEQGEAQKQRDLFEQLVVESLSGDHSSLRRLLEALTPLARRICRSVLGAAHPDLEDSLQDGLVEVTRALSGFRAESCFTHYATKIILRVAIHAKQKGSAQRQRLTLLQAAPESDGGKQADTALAFERARAIRELIGTLPKVQAEALWLRVVLGYSMEESAAISDVPLNTLKTRLRLAKASLRRRIQRDQRARALFTDGAP